ncbi:MAG: aldehyde dehydrogenase family protein [Henriciella sp.]|nr:aldehyde dehydrogenase family protein [Henriciella sp.]
MIAATAHQGSQFEIRNPFDDTVLEVIPAHTPSDAETTIERASTALLRHNRLTRQDRSDILFAAAALLNTRQEAFAELVTRESGKIIRQARKEVLRAVSTLKIAAAEALGLRGEEIPFDAFSSNAAASGYYSWEPIGIVLGITPFNDPLNLVAHKVAPALAVGAPIIIKPSELAPLSALKLRALLIECGMPEPMFQVLVGDAGLGEYLTHHQRVRMISFTGGENTAEAIVRSAGLKKYGFDLGGNAPVIVADSADLDAAVSGCVSGAFWANGHNCISVQRILVDESQFHAFTERFLRQVADLEVGDPLQETTDLGPVISDIQAERIRNIITRSRELDANSIGIGGTASNRLIDPTVFVNPKAVAPCIEEEVFGPIVSIQKFKTIEHAVCMANDTETALNAGLYCRDIGLAHHLAQVLEFSAIMINESSDFRFDNMPFGGAKRGGVGREGVRFAMAEMSHPKVRVTFPSQTFSAMSDAIC